MEFNNYNQGNVEKSELLYYCIRHLNICATDNACFDHYRKFGAVRPIYNYFFAALAVGFRGKTQHKGYSITMMIFAAVSMALYYPHYFIEAGGFKFTGLIIPLIQILMFGMGSSMSAADYIAILKTPKGVLIGIFIGHYVI